MFTPRNESVSNQGERRTPVLATALAVAIGISALAGCSTQVEAKPAASATVEHKLTADQAAAQFAEYKDPTQLELVAGSSADQFGQWVTDLTGKWTLASCGDAKKILTTATDLGIYDNSFYTKVANGNADAMSVAMFGTNWASNDAAKSFRASAIEVNANALDYCVHGDPQDFDSEKFVSAAQTGTDTEGNPIISVNVNVTTGPKSTEQAGPRTYIYDTAVDNGHMVVKSSTISQ